MVGLGRRIRLLATCAAFAVAPVLAFVPAADAQWFLPFGAAPPAEIVNRLRAEGYVLARPLDRRDTVYLADVVRGPHGRERLVIDAWSGEILQRFLARRGGYAPEGGEFSEPPPLGPPPMRDFREGDFGYGQPGFEAPPPRAKVRQRPAATARKGGEPKATPPSAQSAEPQNTGPGSPGAAPAAAAPASPEGGAAANPSASEQAKPESASPKASTPNPAAGPAKEAQPKAETSPSPAPAEAKQAAPAATPPTAEKPADKGEKKVNDVPVNPLD